MPKFKVHLSSTVGATVPIEISQTSIDELGVEGAVLDALESGAAEGPSICARCAGWGQEYSMSGPEDWQEYEVTDENDEVVYTRENQGR